MPPNPNGQSFHVCVCVCVEQMVIVFIPPPNHKLFYLFIYLFIFIFFRAHSCIESGWGFFLAKLFFDNSPMAKSLNLLIIIGLQAIPSLYM